MKDTGKLIRENRTLFWMLGILIAIVLISIGVCWWKNESVERQLWQPFWTLALWAIAPAFTVLLYRLLYDAVVTQTPPTPNPVIEEAARWAIWVFAGTLVVGMIARLATIIWDNEYVFEKVILVCRFCRAIILMTLGAIGFGFIIRWIFNSLSRGTQKVIKDLLWLIAIASFVLFCCIVYEYNKTIDWSKLNKRSVQKTEDTEKKNEKANGNDWVPVPYQNTTAPIQQNRGVTNQKKQFIDNGDGNIVYQDGKNQVIINDDAEPN